MNDNNKIVMKFLNFLDSYERSEIERFKKKVISGAALTFEKDGQELEKKVIVINNFVRLFRISREQWETYRMLCKDFDILSDLLLKSPLDKKERSAIIFHLVEKNIKGKILENSAIIIDYEAIKKHHFKLLTKKELEDEATIYHLLAGEKAENSNLSLEQYHEFYEFACNHVIDISDIQKCHRDIQNHYFNKKTCYQKEDIEVILNSLLDLGVNQELIGAVRSSLQKEMSRNSEMKRIDSMTENFHTVFTLGKVNVDLYRFKNEYSIILKQLEEVVDLKEMIPKCFLNMEQTLGVVELMLRAKIERSNIETFLRNLGDKNALLKVNPIVKYLDLYDKLKYYEVRLVLIEELKNLEDYFQMLSIVDDSEYSFWKSCLEEELKNYILQIPGGFDYEFEEASRRLEKYKKLRKK